MSKAKTRIECVVKICTTLPQFPREVTLNRYERRLHVSVAETKFTLTCSYRYVNNIFSVFRLILRHFEAGLSPALMYNFYHLSASG